MLRDVDMSGCYASILSQLNVCLGRPVIYDPGNRKRSLLAAVNLVQKNSEPDAWFLRVTGDISKIRNTLIPSTDGACTSDKYKRCASRALALHACTRAASSRAS